MAKCILAYVSPCAYISLMSDVRPGIKRPSRGRVVSVRTGEAEYDMLTAAAAKRGLSVSGFLRGAGLEEAERVLGGGSTPQAGLPGRPETATAGGEGAGAASTPTGTVGIKEASVETKRAYVNLNQIARHVNADRVVTVSSDADSDKLAPVLAAVITRCGEVLRALGHPGH